MKNMKQRVLAALMAVLMVLSLLPGNIPGLGAMNVAAEEVTTEAATTDNPEATASADADSLGLTEITNPIGEANSTISTLPVGALLNYDWMSDFFGKAANETLSTTDDTLPVVSEGGFLALTALNQDVTTASNGHGTVIKGLTMQANVPANSVATFTTTTCTYNNAATISIGGNEAKSIAGTNNGGSYTCNDTASVTYTNATNETVTVDIVFSNATVYVKNISYGISAIPETATVTGTLSTAVAGGTLTFTGNDTVDTTVSTDGTYSVDLSVGCSYAVSLSGVTGYRLDTNASVNLTSATAGSTISDQNFTPLY